MIKFCEKRAPYEQEGTPVSDYLLHILDAIGRIERYTASKSLDDFERDEQCQDAVIRNIEIIGEAARNIQQHSPDFVQQHHEIPWAALYAMRNRLSHGYWAVDLAVVWQVIVRDLGELKRELERICGGLEALGAGVLAGKALNRIARSSQDTLRARRNSCEQMLIEETARRS